MSVFNPRLPAGGRRPADPGPPPARVACAHAKRRDATRAIDITVRTTVQPYIYPIDLYS
jgi:hypothetical protein